MKTLFTFMCMLLMPSTFAAHGLALGMMPLYQAGFTHFGYVNPNAPKGGTFTLPIQGGFDTLNPFTLKGDKEAGVSLTLDTLTEQGQDEPFAIYGLLAEDISLATDGLSVTFTLNPKARFHNGEPVLAKDVVYSFYTLTKDPAATQMYKFYWADVAKVEAISERVVRFQFKKRNAELHMILGQLPVFSHKSFPEGLAKAANQLPIGSGPYHFVRADNGRLSEYRRDRNYWAQQLPVRKGMYNFDTVRFRYFKDAAVRVEGIKGGLYDFSQENVAREWARAYPDNVLAKRNLIKQTWPQQQTAGLQGFVMNQRRAFFKDVRVRQALVWSFDFESINSRLFYGSYQRSNSFFTNSNMAAYGKPDAAELALLTPLRAQLPKAVFQQNAPNPPVTDAVLGIRPNLLQARQLLLAAGYRYQQGLLVDKQGKPIIIEFLTPSKVHERVVAKWQRDLAKLGMTMNVRIVDSAVYQKRLNDFDFDMTIVVYANTESPGNEQFDYYSCQAAQTKGSRNWAGICDPAVEQLLKQFEHFNNRTELITATRALDRVLRHQYLVVPNWYSNQYRVIYRNTLGIPQRAPKYYTASNWALQTWWVKPKP